MAYFPMFVDLTGKECLLVGGGNVALHKACVLLDFGAALTVVAPQIAPEFSELPVQCRRRAFAPKDVEGCALVVAATDDKAANHAVAEAARAAHVAVNAVDQPEDCDFLFPSYVRTGDVVGAFSSAGQSPVVTQYLKEQALPLFSERLGAVSAYLGTLRPLVKERIKTQEKRKAFYRNALQELLSRETPAFSREELERYLDESARS